MKKVLALVLALIMVLAIVACGQKPAETEKPAETKTEEKKDYSGYTIRIYSNSNSAERVTWLVEKAKEAGFTISLDTNEVYSGDTAANLMSNRVVPLSTFLRVLRITVTRATLSILTRLSRS